MSLSKLLKYKFAVCLPRRALSCKSRKLLIGEELENAVNQVVRELEDEKNEGEREEYDRQIDSDTDQEEEVVTKDLYSSESEQSEEELDIVAYADQQCQQEDDYCFFIGRDNETIWISKPLSSANLDYNATKGGVDTVDQMCASYSTSRITRRWPLTVFFRHLDISGINSNVIFKFNNINNKDRRRVFLKNLALQLMEYHLKQRSLIERLPKDLQAFLSKYKNNDQATPRETAKPGICYICGKHKNSKTKSQCDKVRPVPKKRQVTEEELQMHLGGAVASAALGIGMDMQRVKLALKQRLELTGRGYSQPDALVEAALNLQLDEDDGFDSNSSGNNQLGTIIGAALNDINKASESNGQNQLTAQDTAPCQPHHSDTNGERTARHADLPCDFRLKKSIPLEEENRILKEARQCKICMDAEVGIVFLPCGHLTTCVNCAPNLEDCPMCRSAIKATVRTFLS
ncbi:hypothetical protein HUJ04_010958 [Dendroctonus ponderosae]|nr:hypothetical protein HUJ04_010958 [Dendroctonus ponderosae]